jgi:uncharacterized protein YbjQ (UPF0145 family)
VTGPDGDWLPASARTRLARFDAAGLRTSLLPVAGAVGIESVGLAPVGEVMGCIVQYVGWVGGQTYGLSMGYGTGMFGGSVSYQPYVNALYHGYNTALARMLTEARAMGADGVVGVKLTLSPLAGGNQEFVALGTAVRARSRSRPKKLFTTELAGQDVAKLMHAGWVPARIAIGIAVESRFLDYTTRSQLSMLAGNTEVSAHTQLTNLVRARARERFAKQAKENQADGAIVSALNLRFWHQEINNAPLLCAESSVFGTSLARFHAGTAAPTRALTIMPLRQKEK